MLLVISLHGSSNCFSIVVILSRPPFAIQVCFLFSLSFILFFSQSLIIINKINIADDPKKIDHLLKLDGAKERLKVFKANLLEEGSFDSVVEGCYGVFHTASPFFHDVKDPQVFQFLINNISIYVLFFNSIIIKLLISG